MHDHIINYNKNPVKKPGFVNLGAIILRIKIRIV